MAKYSIDSSTLTDIANAIRTQYGEDSPIAVTDMAEAILGIEGGGGGNEVIEVDLLAEATRVVLATDTPLSEIHSIMAWCINDSKVYVGSSAIYISVARLCTSPIVSSIYFEAITNNWRTPSIVRPNGECLTEDANGIIIDLKPISSASFAPSSMNL